MPIFDAHTYLGGSIVPGVAHNPAAIQATMQDRGVDAAMVLSARARSVDPVAGNRILRAMLEQAPSLYGCVVTHVNRVEESISAMRELLPSRRFVAMAVAGARPGQSVSKSAADEVVNAYRRYSKPLFLFTPDGSAVQHALEIAQGYPMLKVVFLGMGGADWRAAVSAAHTATNVFLEISGTLDRVKLPVAVAEIGPHRLIFGSGSPHVDAASTLGLLEDSALSEEVKRRILWSNAERLFGIALADEPESEQPA